MRRSLVAVASALLLGATSSRCVGAQAPAAASARPRSAEELVRFFTEWRDFQRPRIVDGVPDYSAAAMTAQARAATALRRRLAAFDTTAANPSPRAEFWPIPTCI